jgi:hypothetical protein
MKHEILQAKGQLADWRKEYRELDLQASGLIVVIRNELSPYTEDVTTLRVDQAAVAMNQLQKVVARMRELKGKIEDLGAALDG